MPGKADSRVRHYDANYGNFQTELYAEIRREAFGEDIGQSSWLTADEQDRFLRLLELSPGKRLLDVACGSGGPALRSPPRLVAPSLASTCTKMPSPLQPRWQRRMGFPVAPNSVLPMAPSPYPFPPRSSTLLPASMPSIICATARASSLIGLACSSLGDDCFSRTRLR